MASPTQLSWFCALLQRHDRRLVSFAHALLRDEQQAYDVVQEAFVAAWRAALQRRRPFANELDEEWASRWLFQVVYRRAVSLRRHDAVIAWESLNLPDSPHLGALATDVGFEDQIAEGGALNAALALLSPADAACVLLHVVHGFSVSEVARVVGINRAAAR